VRSSTWAEAEAEVGVGMLGSLRVGEDAPKATALALLFCLPFRDDSAPCMLVSASAVLAGDGMGDNEEEEEEGDGEEEGEGEEEDEGGEEEEEGGWVGAGT
jgi:hypothetical protein